MARPKRVRLLRPLHAYGELFRKGTVLEVEQEYELAYQVHFVIGKKRYSGTVIKIYAEEMKRG